MKIPTISILFAFFPEFSMGQKTPAPAVSGLLDSSLTNGLETRSSDDGRACDFSDGYYVSWADTSNAIRYWCSVHSDVIVLNGKSVDDLTVTGYKSGKWKVQLHGESSRLHLASPFP